MNPHEVEGIWDQAHREEDEAMTPLDERTSSVLRYHLLHHLLEREMKNERRAERYRMLLEGELAKCEGPDRPVEREEPNEEPDDNEDQRGHSSG